MRETAWLCKPYPEQHRGGMRASARRISRGGGIEPVRQRKAKIDGRSRQNSAYRTGHAESRSAFAERLFLCLFEQKIGSAAERAEGKEKEDKNCFAMVDKYRASSYNRTIQ